MNQVAESQLQVLAIVNKWGRKETGEKLLLSRFSCNFRLLYAKR